MMGTAALGHRVAGLFMFGFAGTRPEDVPAQLVAGAAGVILFRRNIESAHQLRALTDAIASVPRTDGLPPLVAIDQEGGTVSRLAGIGTTIPSAMALGATGDAALTQSMYRLTGDELFALGINLDLAPVADLNLESANPSVGTRSFGDDAQEVSGHVRAAVRGLHGAGVAATAKHFPGHGNTTVDSHLDLPSIALSKEQWQSGERRTFAAAVDERVDCVMTAHAAYPSLDSGKLPATLSPAILGTLLREELGFAGVICTDCLEMEAIRSRWAPDEAVRTAICAGADLMLFSHSPGTVAAVVETIERAVVDGSISAERVKASVARVDALRKRLAARPRSPSDDLSGIVGTQVHRDAAFAAWRRAITIVRDPHGLVPLRLGADQKILCVQFTGGAATPVEDGRKASGEGPSHSGRIRQVTAIGAALAHGPARVHEQIRGLDPAGHEYKQILMAAGSADAVVVVTSRANHHPLQAQVVADLQLIGKRLIVVAAREPYDADVLPMETTVLASFGEDPNAMRAAAEVALGEPATGRLPVRLVRCADQVR